MNKSKLILPTPGTRNAILLERRNLKMARSTQSYVRGSTLKFYEWLEAASTGKMPEGPPIWICGDCHIGNLGPVANAKGHIDIHIRDFDQTVIGNPIHDVIRLALSLATAVRDSDLPGVTTVKMLEQLIEGYEQAFDDSGDNMADNEHPHSVHLALKEASSNSWKHLAKNNTEDVHPSMPLGKRFWPISKSESKAINTLFAQKEIARLATVLGSRTDDAAVSVLDAAYWVKGCSSLGQLRYAVILDVDKEVSKGKDFCLMDIKEANQAAAPRASKVKMPRAYGDRVIEGARHLSPHLGERMMASTLMGKSIFIRELLPQDLKLEIGQLKTAETMITAKYLASVVGKAHARQMDATTQAAWRKELQRNRSKNIDAPSWLWDSIVELVACHEASYLEHCRSYAMQIERFKM